MLLTFIDSKFRSNNEFDSPKEYVPYDGINGPTDGHEWLAGHPFY